MTVKLKYSELLEKYNKERLLPNELLEYLNKDELLSNELLNYLNRQGRFLSDKAISMIIRHKNVDESVLNLLLDKCFDEQLIRKPVCWDSPTLWGSKGYNGIPNVDILDEFLKRENITFELFIKILNKIKICGYFKLYVTDYSKINDLSVRFFNDSSLSKENLVLLFSLINPSSIYIDEKVLKAFVENPLIGENEIVDIFGRVYIVTDKLKIFVGSNKASDKIFNNSILKSLEGEPSFYVKELIGIIQSEDSSYVNCLCDTVKEQCSISGDFNRKLHPLVLSFCIAGTFEQKTRKACCKLQNNNNVDFVGLSDYFYDNDIKRVDDLFDNDGNLNCDISTKVIEFIGNELFDLFKAFCLRLRTLFDIEKYELDSFGELEYENEVDKFMVLCSLVMNKVPKGDKLDDFINKYLGDKYKRLYDLEAFTKKFSLSYNGRSYIVK